MTTKVKKFNRIFQPDLIYVFSFKKYKQVSRRLKFKPHKWTKELNGRLVVPNIVPGRTGTILGTGYSINVNWCKCIGKKV